MVLLTVFVQLTVLVLEWLMLGWLCDPSNPLKKLPSPRPESSVMDLAEDGEVEVAEEENEEDDDECDVPGPLEMVAGDELEPSSSKTN